MLHSNLYYSQILRSLLPPTIPYCFFNRFAKLPRQNDITMESSCSEPGVSPQNSNFQTVAQKCQTDYSATFQSSSLGMSQQFLHVLKQREKSLIGAGGSLLSLYFQHCLNLIFEG